MISSAISGLGEKGGSSRKAILKHIIASNKVLNTDEAKVQNRVRLAVKRMLAAKKLVPGSAKSAKGTNGSFKLADKPKIKKVKKLVAKKPKAKKATPKKKLHLRKKQLPKRKKQSQRNTQRRLSSNQLRRVGMLEKKLQTRRSNMLNLHPNVGISTSFNIYYFCIGI